MVERSGLLYYIHFQEYAFDILVLPRSASLNASSSAPFRENPG